MARPEPRHDTLPPPRVTMPDTISETEVPSRTGNCRGERESPLSGRQTGDMVRSYPVPLALLSLHDYKWWLPTRSDAFGASLIEVQIQRAEIADGADFVPIGNGEVPFFTLNQTVFCERFKRPVDVNAGQSDRVA